MQERRQPEIIGGYVGSAGEILRGDGFAVQKTATANYQVTITAPGFRLVSVTAMTTGGNMVAVVVNVTQNSFLIVTYVASTGSGADIAFLFTAVGVQQ